MIENIECISSLNNLFQETISDVLTYMKSSNETCIDINMTMVHFVCSI